MRGRALPGAVVVLLAAALFSGCATLSSTRRDDRIFRKDFRWPVHGTVTSGFGHRAVFDRHEGIDIAALAGTPVRASETGMVAYAGNGKRGYGNAVVLDHGEGVTTLYGHLDAIRVKSAEAVPAGAPVGTVGRTGNATSDHLHFELRIDGVAVDPAKYLNR